MTPELSLRLPGSLICQLRSNFINNNNTFIHAVSLIIRGLALNSDTTLGWCAFPSLSLAYPCIAGRDMWFLSSLNFPFSHHYCRNCFLLRVRMVLEKGVLASETKLDKNTITMELKPDIWQGNFRKTSTYDSGCKEIRYIPLWDVAYEEWTMHGKVVRIQIFFESQHPYTQSPHQANFRQDWW